MPDYGPTPRVKEVDFGKFGPVPRIKRVKKLPLQLGREYRMLLQASMLASRVAGSQMAALTRAFGLKGKRVHELRWLAEERAAADTVRLLRKQWRDLGIKMAPIEAEFSDWYDLYKEAEGLPPEEAI